METVIVFKPEVRILLHFFSIYNKTFNNPIFSDIKFDTHLFKDRGVILNEPLLEYLPLEGRDAGVKGGQLPQRHNLVAHAAARILAGL